MPRYAITERAGSFVAAHRNTGVGTVLELTERQLALDLMTALRDLSGAHDTRIRFAGPLVRLRESNLTGARRLLTEGMSPLLDVVTAQRDLIAAQRALAQAEHDAALAAFRLRIALGGS